MMLSSIELSSDDSPAMGPGGQIGPISPHMVWNLQISIAVRCRIVE